MVLRFQFVSIIAPWDITFRYINMHRKGSVTHENATGKYKIPGICSWVYAYQVTLMILDEEGIE